jgi:hypothetical protein
MSCNCLEPVIFSLSATTSQAKVGFSCLDGEGSQKYLNFRAQANSNSRNLSTNNPSTWTDNRIFETKKQSKYIYMVQDYGIITVYENKNYIYEGEIDITDDCCPGDGDFNYTNYTSATLTTNPPRIQCQKSDPEDPLSPTIPVVISAEDVLSGETTAGLYEAEICTPQIINCGFIGLPATCPPGSQGSAGTATPTCESACTANVGCTGGNSRYSNNFRLYDCRFSMNGEKERDDYSASNNVSQNLGTEVTDDFVYGICKESTTKKIQKLKTNVIDTCDPLTNPDQNWNSFSNGIVVSAKVVNNIPTAQQVIFRVSLPKEYVKNNIEVQGKFYLYIGETCQNCCIDEDNFGGTILASEAITIYPASDQVMTKGDIEYVYKDVQITYDNGKYSQYAGQTINACFTLISSK